MLSSTWASCLSTVEVLRRTELRPSDGIASLLRKEMQMPLLRWHDWAPPEVVSLCQHANANPSGAPKCFFPKRPKHPKPLVGRAPRDQQDGKGDISKYFAIAMKRFLKHK
jgi:hypothetical protein